MRCMWIWFLQLSFTRIFSDWNITVHIPFLRCKYITNFNFKTSKRSVPRVSKYKLVGRIRKRVMFNRVERRKRDRHRHRNPGIGPIVTRRAASCSNGNGGRRAWRSRGILVTIFRKWPKMGRVYRSRNRDRRACKMCISLVRWERVWHRRHGVRSRQRGRVRADHSSVR